MTPATAPRAAPSARVHAPLIQRTCACGPNCDCEECRKKRIQRKAVSKAVPRQERDRASIGMVRDVLGTAGQPLDPDTRQHFEDRFQQSFGHVRIHADSQASRSADAVNALAYTVGSHIAFAAGQYAPRQPAGMRLIAHELAHTIQQSRTSGELGNLSIDSHSSPFEYEAERVATRVTNGESAQVRQQTGVPRVQTFSVTNEPAGGCGICYDVEFPGKGPQNAGRVAHTVVQGAFMGALSGIGQYRFVELPFSAPNDENGRLDLAVATSTGYAIGEIKPATPNGEAQGTEDLYWYLDAVAAANPGSTVEPLITGIPAGGGLPMPDALAATAGCVQQLLGVVMMRPGLFGYFCQPPYSRVRSTCTCKPPIPPPVPFPKDVKVREPKDVKVRDPRGVDEPVGSPVPAFARTLAAIAALTALSAMLPKLKGLIKSRVLAAATAMAAIVLLAKGAEASIGGGDDPLEALIKNADARGDKLPDDIKEALRKDTRLRELLQKAAKTGNYDEARRKAGEAFTRFIIENRDQFTEEELNTLLTATENVSDRLPEGAKTVEQIKQAIRSKNFGSGHGRPAGPGGSSPTSKGPGSPTEDQPAPAPAPAPAQSKDPAERLVEGMVSPDSKGPKLTEAARGKLLTAARSFDPPLTDQEVDELLKKLQSGAGKNVDEIIESVRKSVTGLRAKAGGGSGTGNPDAEPGKTTPAQKPDEATSEGTLPSDPQKLIEELARRAAKANFKGIPAGKYRISWTPDETKPLATGSLVRGELRGKFPNGTTYLGFMTVKVVSMDTNANRAKVEFVRATPTVTANGQVAFQPGHYIGRTDDVRLELLDTSSTRQKRQKR